MSSATSIDRDVRLKPDAAPVGPDQGFRPWHFFLLASLVMATIAVMMARQSTPEHLILISITIISAGLAAAALYRTLAPLASDDVSLFSEPLSERGRAAIEREKRLVLRSIKELEFDRAMGKVSPKDFEEMSGRLRSRAIALMKQLDEGSTGYRDLIEKDLQIRLSQVRSDTSGVRLQPDPMDTSGVRLQPDLTCACGTANDVDAAFCKRCGAKL
jgi:hypothetical protein